MTVFATPDGRPFYCGTYFPPRPASGMPAFRQFMPMKTESSVSNNTIANNFTSSRMGNAIITIM